MFVTIAIPQYFLDCFAAFGFFKAKKKCTYPVHTEPVPSYVWRKPHSVLWMWQSLLPGRRVLRRDAQPLPQPPLQLQGSAHFIHQSHFWHLQPAQCCFLSTLISTSLLTPWGASVIDFSQNTHQILRSIHFQLLPQTAQPKAAARGAQIMQSQLFLQW